MIRLGDIRRLACDASGRTRERLPKNMGVTPIAARRLKVRLGGRGYKMDTVVRFVDGCNANLLVSIALAHDSACTTFRAVSQSAVTLDALGLLAIEGFFVKRLLIEFEGGRVRVVDGRRPMDRTGYLGIRSEICRRLRRCAVRRIRERCSPRWSPVPPPQGTPRTASPNRHG